MTTTVPEMLGSLTASTRRESQHFSRGIPLHLALSWTCILVAGVAGAVYTQYYTSNEEEEEKNAAFLLDERFLAHEHEHVYNEEHAPLLPLKPSDYWGFSFAVIGLMMAAGGGIGGGGILVPIYCLVMGFSPKHAIPLSNITVFGGSIANTLLNVKKRHPLADRPLIDWDLILVMEPLTIAGALIGAFLNKILPELLLTVLLVILLSVTARESLQKAFKMFRKETEEYNKRLSAESELTRTFLAQKEGHDDDEEDEGHATPVTNETPTAFKDSPVVPTNEAEEKTSLVQNDDDEKDLVEDPLVDHAELELERRRQEELEQIMFEEREIPMLNVNILVTLFIVVLTINILKGGGAFPSPFGIKCGSTGFWMSNFVMLAWILIISTFVRLYLVKRYEAKKRCGYQYVEGDIQWDSRATIVYPFLCCFAGFFAGMFGVGGGIVKGPLMLSMNVHPAVASASSACMILFTSFTATTSFVVFGLLVEDYAVICCFIGFISTLLGQVGLSYLARKAQRNSYIAFSIGGVVLISAFLMTVQSLLSMAEGEKHHAGGICGKGD